MQHPKHCRGIPSLSHNYWIIQRLEATSFSGYNNNNYYELLCSTEHKPNFELSSLPFATSVPVHYDPGKFQHSLKDTKRASPQLIFQGH